MNIGYVFLIVIAGMAYLVTGIPTPDEMQANFQAAQKFYTSGAYDQALEAYQEVADVQSRFVEEENVVLADGTIGSIADISFSKPIMASYHLSKYSFSIGIIYEKP